MHAPSSRTSIPTQLHKETYIAISRDLYSYINIGLFICACPILAFCVQMCWPPHTALRPAAPALTIARFLSLAPPAQIGTPSNPSPSISVNRDLLHGKRGLLLVSLCATRPLQCVVYGCSAHSLIRAHTYALSP